MNAQTDTTDLARALAELNAGAAEGSNGVIWTPELVRFLTTCTFGFMAFALLLAAVLLWRAGASGVQVLRVFGILTIVGLSALLLFVGYSNDQLTPIVGLFGAIAGYLLGRDSTPSAGELRK